MNRRTLVIKIHEVLLRHHQHDEFVGDSTLVKACHCGKPWSTRHQAEMIAEMVDA